MTTRERPEFATNGPTERVADAITSYLRLLLETQRHPPELAIATAYFNPDGYLLLADELDDLGGVRLLLGAEPPALEWRLRHLGKDTPPPARPPARSVATSSPSTRRGCARSATFSGSRSRPTPAPAGS